MATIPAGAFRTSDIANLGITTAQLRAWLDGNAVRRVLHGIFVRSDLPDTQELRLECAALVLPEHTVIADRSAAWLHGIDCFDHADLVTAPRLEVVSIDGHQPQRRPELLGGKRELRPDDICEIGGLRVTTPLRTACDVASLHGRRRALGVLDAFRREFGLEVEDFMRLLPRLAKRRGVIQVRELVPLSSPLPESMPESWIRMTIIDEQLPAPKPQVWVFVSGYGQVRLDLAYAELKIAVEYDGEEFHSSDEDQAADSARREALRRAGWIVIVVRKDGFSGASRDKWIQELKDALAERLPERRTKRIYSRGERLGSYRRARTRM
jgi:hypothetical protein